MENHTFERTNYPCEIPHDAIGNKCREDFLDMDAVANSTPSESQNAYKLNGNALIQKQAHPSNSDGRYRRQHPQ